MKWGASLDSRQQSAIQRIERSLASAPGPPSSCGCFSLADTLIRCPDLDRSLKQSALAIFCEEPPDADEALDVLPATVIEDLSLGYEEKGLADDAALFYVAWGVADVLAHDPRSGRVPHYQGDDRGLETLQAPVTMELVCGYRVQL
jgi:hypothetical protein